MKRLTHENLLKLRQTFENVNTVDDVEGRTKFGVFVFNVKVIMDETSPDVILSSLDMLPTERSIDGSVLNAGDTSLNLRGKITTSAVSLMEKGGDAGSVISYINCARRDRPLKILVPTKPNNDMGLLRSFAICMSMVSGSKPNCDQLKHACLHLYGVTEFMKNNRHVLEMKEKYYFYWFLSFLLDQCLGMKKFENAVYK